MAEAIFTAALVFALAGISLMVVRLVRGPAAADRAVAIDGMTVIAIALIVFIAYWAGRIIYLDVALVYALISFVGIIALARYLEKGL